MPRAELGWGCWDANRSCGWESPVRLLRDIQSCKCSWGAGTALEHLPLLTIPSPAGLSGFLGDATKQAERGSPSPTVSPVLPAIPPQLSVPYSS